MNTVHEFDIRKQEITKITILSDRAEIKRSVPVSMKAGINEVQLKHFSHCLQSDSVRVDGCGKSTICDVTEKNIPALRSETDTEKMAELRRELENYESIKKKQEDQKGVMVKKIEGLDRTVGEIGKGVMNPSNESGNVVIDEKLLEGLQKLLDFHETEAESLKLSLREREEEILKTVEKINKISNELNRMKTWGRWNTCRAVIITLEAFEEVDVQLDITYQVFESGWQPSYDIRVDTQKPSMTITYYGKLYNRCGEDWTEFPAVLSTAQPSLGGQIPELGTLDAHFYRHVEPKRSFNLMKRSMGRRSRKAEEVEEERMSVGEDDNDVEMARTPMEVNHNTLSTEFKIARKSNLPNGTEDHKVTIGTSVFTPSLVHESVPSKIAAAFLTASAVNSSVLPFLPGETSIFLNNAFVAKSHMKNVVPGERFTCSLGVDTAIRVEYKPAKKFHEEGGYITKHSAHATEQTISIKNTRSEQPILLTIKHHVPRSTDEKIRVKLASPVASPYDPATTVENEVLEPREGVRMNKDHNLEWTVKMAPNSSKDLVIKWIIEHAKGQNIMLQEKI
ncbi:Protein CBG18975 [Caenorhabditis briggsae]|uniref:Protein CBG18975 n=1 Tax=Caenorhabditis briggsae TaxID=6238 RepID=A8XUH1_CAEBR|nr:Protein CBG18975 [Caenorhabditis briggsae]CAP36296.1 Protein CBG18975 [Caenorhabditis briggsae]